MTATRMGSKCLTPPNTTAKTCFSKMPQYEQYLLGRKPHTCNGWVLTTWWLWKGCCLNNARVQVGDQAFYANTCDTPCKGP